MFPVALWAVPRLFKTLKLLGSISLALVNNSLALIKLIEDNKFRISLQKKAWENYPLTSKNSSKKLNLIRKNLILNYDWND